MCCCSLISTKACAVCPDYEEDDPYNQTQEPGYGVLECTICGCGWNYYTTIDNPDICPDCGICALQFIEDTSGRIP